MLELEQDIASIHYHRDFDGVVAAAMLDRLSRSTPQLRAEQYPAAEFLTERLTKPAAVVDYVFHPDASIWVDHHSTPFRKNEWRSIAERNPYCIWDQTAPSCPDVISRHFTFPDAAKRHFREYTKWASIIDSASFASASEATDLSNPYLLLATTIAATSSTELVNQIVHAVATLPIRDVLNVRSARTLARQVHDLQHEIDEQFKYLVTFDGVVALFDQSGKNWPYQRYHAYLMHDDARYVVGVYRNEAGFAISVGANPWLGDRSVDVGSLCARWGGGGRESVGGITASCHRQTMSIANEVADILHRTARSRRVEPESGAGAPQLARLAPTRDGSPRTNR